MQNKFSISICEKFPVQTGRHLANATNALWMLRNHPISPFNELEKNELKNIIKSERI